MVLIYRKRRYNDSFDIMNKNRTSKEDFPLHKNKINVYFRSLFLSGY